MEAKTEEERLVERESACLWLFDKEAFPLQIKVPAARNASETVFYISLRVFFPASVFALRSFSGVEFGPVMLEVV